MKRIGSIVILIRVILLLYVLMKFGVDTATTCGVFLIAIDSLKIMLDIEEIKNNDV